jgi:hypothetical protein
MYLIECYQDDKAAADKILEANASKPVRVITSTNDVYVTKKARIKAHFPTGDLTSIKKMLAVVTDDELATTLRINYKLALSARKPYHVHPL